MYLAGNILVFNLIERRNGETQQLSLYEQMWNLFLNQAEIQ